MDIERMKKLLESGIEAGNKVKEVREVVKTFKTQKQDMYDDTAQLLKPSFDVQEKRDEVRKEEREKRDKLKDEKQDELIEQLKQNQERIVKAINFNTAKAIGYDGKKLPEIPFDYDSYKDELVELKTPLEALETPLPDDDDDELDLTKYDNEGDDEEEVEPSTSEKAFAVCRV